MHSPSVGGLGTAPRLRGRVSRRGITVLELTVTLAILVIALLGALGSISSYVVLGDASRDSNIAYLEAQRMIERMQSEPFIEIFRRYNTSGVDDPAGQDTAPGDGFTVTGLEAQERDADGMAGRILFPVLDAAPTVLREDVNDHGFQPRDLNSDDQRDAQDHTLDYDVLPVRVRVEWRGKTGNRFIELQTLMRSQ